MDINTLEEDENLFEFGVPDSLGFLEPVAAVEERFGLEVDFTDMHPAEFTTFKGLVHLCNHSPQAS